MVALVSNVGRGLVERGKGSSVGGLDGGLWWFSDGDGDQESSRTHNDGHTVGDRENTHKKPVAHLEGVGPPMPASGPLRASQERAGQALVVAHAALMQARLHCKLQEQCGTNDARASKEWRLPPRSISFSGQRVPDPPASLGLLPFGPFPDTFLFLNR